MTAGSAVQEVQHTLLEYRGGAARVSKLIAECRSREGAEVTRSFEFAETPEGEKLLAERPPYQLIADSAEQGAVFHLHSSTNYPELLGFLKKRSAKVILTFHDCRLFTGGCPSPLDCELHRQGCGPVCPRDYPNSQDVAAGIRAAVNSLQPILVSPSRWLKQLAQPYFDSTIKIVPNGVPWPQCIPEKGRKLAARKALGVAPDGKVVLFLAHGARASAYKGGNTWLRIWEMIEKAETRAVAVFAGGEKQSRSGNLVELPYLHAQALQTVLLAADVLVYPTRADNHPLVVMEAMAAGCAVVSYAVGGVVEQIQDGVNGVLVKPGNMVQIAERAAELLANDALRRNMTRTAFESGRKRFAASTMCSGYSRIFRKLHAE